MNEPQRRRRKVDADGQRERREASRRGAATVKQAFTEALTRRVFAERVGVHLTTVRRWEALAIVTPKRQTVLNIPTLIFDEADVQVGRAVVELLRDHRGTMTLQQASEIVKRQGPR